MAVRVQSTVTEPIQAIVRDATGALLTGLSDLYVRLRRESDGFYLDWADDTFKAAGWTTLDKSLTELDAVRSPGLYGVTGGLNLAAITNAVPNDNYLVSPLQTPGTNAVLPEPGELKIDQWIHTPADVATYLETTGPNPHGTGAWTGSTAGAVAAAVWSLDISTNANLDTQSGGQLNFIRQIMDNKMEETFGAPGLVRVWDDANISVIRTWQTADLTGGGVVGVVGAVARKTKGA